MVEAFLSQSVQCSAVQLPGVSTVNQHCYSSEDIPQSESSLSLNIVQDAS